MIRRIPFEAVIWLAALIVLTCYVPTENHFTLCPLSNLGFDFCPGCGLGHSISLLLHGKIRESFDAHPLGIFAFIVLSFRILQLSKHYYKQYGQSN